MKQDDFGPGAVFVLGGSGGIGGAICLAFAKAGVPVAFSYRTNAQSAEAVANQVRAADVEPVAYCLDASDPAAVVQALSSAAKHFGGLHSVVYAGGPTFEPEFFGRTSTEVWREWLENDVLGAINLAQAALPHLRQTKGAFAAISTYQGGLIEVRGGPSAISKAAVDRMVAVIAKEEGRFGVRANSLRCGWFDVEANRRLFERHAGLEQKKQGDIPLRRLGRPEEVGDAILFLCSRRAAFITGVNLTADGGESL